MIVWILLGVAVLLFLMGIRIVSQTERGVAETLGKFSSYREPGFHWIFPIIQSIKKINVTERLADIEPQEIITKENLNAEVDLMVYYKVKSDEKSVYKAFYNVDNFEDQIVKLAQTTARNVIGDMLFRDVNSKRDTLNQELAKILKKETESWGVDIVRVEMKEIRPPKDVQDTMNKIIMAENEKDAAKDVATALETRADGEKRAAVKKAEGVKTANVLEAEGIAKGKIIVAEATAQQIKLVNDAAKKHFTGNAVKLKQLEVTESSLKNNAKIILTEKGINPSIILGNLPTESSK